MIDSAFFYSLCKMKVYEKNTDTIDDTIGL